MEGGTILNALGKADFTLARKTECMSQIARALAYLHSRKPVIIHRDVKPSNILLSADWTHAKLGDFGISKTLQASVNVTLTSGNIGTPEYCAPEVFDPKEGAGLLLAKIDVYSFCMTLHHVMTNEKPFANCANVMQIMFSVSKGERPELKGLPASFRQIVARGWDAQAVNRPTMQELLAVLNPASAALALEEQELREDATKCVVCLAGLRSHVLIPCGHLCACNGCADALKKCPICRAGVTSRVFVFK